MEQQTGEEGRGGQKTKIYAVHAWVYSSLSLEGNIISLCLLCQQIPKGKRPLSANTDCD